MENLEKICCQSEWQNAQTENSRSILGHRVRAIGGIIFEAHTSIFVLGVIACSRSSKSKVQSPALTAFVATSVGGRNCTYLTIPPTNPICWTYLSSCLAIDCQTNFQRQSLIYKSKTGSITMTSSPGSTKDIKAARMASEPPVVTAISLLGSRSLPWIGE